MSDPRIIQNSDTAMVREGDESAVIAATPAIIQGAPGPAGPQGADGGIANAFDGEWNSSAAYSSGRLVTYTGALWLSLAPSTNVQPGSAGGATYWTVLADKGDTGPQGETGPAGGSGSNTNVYIPTWRGAWSTGKTYAVGDWVRLNEIDNDYHGSVYHCKEAHSSSSTNGPTDDSQKWSLAVESKRGRSIRGPRGYPPYIGSNHNWFTKDEDGNPVDTGVDARGQKGDPGNPGDPGQPGAAGTDAYADLCFNFLSNTTLRALMPRTITFTTLDVTSQGSVSLAKNGSTFSLAGSDEETFSPGDVLSVTVSGLGSGDFKAVTLRGSYGS